MVLPVFTHILIVFVFFLPKNHQNTMCQTWRAGSAGIVRYALRYALQLHSLEGQSLAIGSLSFSAGMYDQEPDTWICLPSRELTYPKKNGILKMIFLFPRWDMLILWRIYKVIFFCFGFRKNGTKSPFFTFLTIWDTMCWELFFQHFPRANPRIRWRF